MVPKPAGVSWFKCTIGTKYRYGYGRYGRICYFRMSFIKCMFVLKFNLDHLESVLLELATMTHGQVDITTSKPYFEKVFHIENHIHFKSHIHMESILWIT